MVTAVTATAISSTAGSAAGAAGTGSAGGPQLSDLARQALDGLGRMQQDFSIAPTALRGGTPSAPATGSEALSASMDAMRASVDAALRVQGQIVQFSMATSISQSLGNNLNSFLKGS